MVYHSSAKICLAALYRDNLTTVSFIHFLIRDNPDLAEAKADSRVSGSAKVNQSYYQDDVIDSIRWPSGDQCLRRHHTGKKVWKHDPLNVDRRSAPVLDGTATLTDERYLVAHI